MTDFQELFLTYLTEHLSLSKRAREFLLTLPIFKIYSKGTMLFEEGDLTEEYYLVMSGCVRTYLIVDGDEITTGFYTEKDALIPVSTAIRAPSSSYAVCYEDSMIVVSSKKIEDLIFSHFPMFQSFCRRFSESLLAKKQKSTEEHRTLNPEARYLKIIQQRPDLIQRIPQYHIASYLGLRPESLSRIRKRIALK